MSCYVQYTKGKLEGIEVPDEKWLGYHLARHFTEMLNKLKAKEGRLCIKCGQKIPEDETYYETENGMVCTSCH